MKYSYMYEIIYNSKSDTSSETFLPRHLFQNLFNSLKVFFYSKYSHLTLTLFILEGVKYSYLTNNEVFITN